MKLPGAQDAASVAAELRHEGWEERPAAPKRQRKACQDEPAGGLHRRISEENAAKLNEIGVRTTEDLLDPRRDAQGSPGNRQSDRH